LPVGATCGSNAAVELAAHIRTLIKAGRRRGTLWVRFLDVVRLLPTAEGRARLWTRLVHRSEVHQTTPFTAEDRYPELFDLAAKLTPRARRILSFGCSTGEELIAIRRRFPLAEIVGAEINPRSRRIAVRNLAADRAVRVVPPREIGGSFDLIFALAVLQCEPHAVEEMGIDDLSRRYPFDRFDKTVTDFAERLEPGGVLCVTSSLYRIEDSSASARLHPVRESPEAPPPFFGRDGRRLTGATARTFFRKGGPGGRQGGAR